MILFVALYIQPDFENVPIEIFSHLTDCVWLARKSHLESETEKCKEPGEETKEKRKMENNNNNKKNNLNDDGRYLLWRIQKSSWI